MRSPSNQFITEKTLDGSPTLRSLHGSVGSTTPESMHHTNSAAGETEYIYGEALRRALTLRSENLNFLIVGLGLAYIEILILAQVSDCQINSYEIDVDLKNNFLNWLQGCQDFEIYNEVCKSLKLNSDVVRSKFKKNKFVLNSELNCETQFATQNNVICFDAFSRKTSGELWTEEFLNYFILKACAEDCIFVTYSCTSLLKRVLINNKFTLISRLGFSGKRESTLAVRGVFVNLK